MQKRPSSRLLVIDSQGRVLLFRFEHRSGPLAGTRFWATPGGGVEAGESFADAARRELFEELGLACNDPGAPVAQRTAIFRSPSGDMIEADERYFVIRVDSHEISRDNWTDVERDVMVAHRWFSQAELQSLAEQLWPEDLARILTDAGVPAAFDAE